MSSKYLSKIATTIDMSPDGKIQRIHSDPSHDARARAAKLVNKPKMNKYLKGALVGGAVAKTAVSGYAAKKLYDAYQAKKTGSQEKQAFLGMSADSKKELVNTGTIAAAGGLTSTIANKMLHPNIKGGGMKAFAIGGGLGLVGDYAAVKLNNKINQHIDKAAAISIDPKNKGLLHKKMGVGQGKHISTGALEAEKAKAKASGNTKLEREVVFAENAKHWNHK